MRSLLFALLVLVAACASAEGPPEPTPPQQDTCGLARFSHMIGVRADQIDRAVLPPATRIIRPNQAVTMDYSAQRLNLMTDEAGVISEMRCF